MTNGALDIRYGAPEDGGNFRGPISDG
jgi:hypothetical protein